MRAVLTVSAVLPVRLNPALAPAHTLCEFCKTDDQDKCPRCNAPATHRGGQAAMTVVDLKLDTATQYERKNLLTINTHTCGEELRRGLHVGTVEEIVDDK